MTEAASTDTAPGDIAPTGTAPGARSSTPAVPLPHHRNPVGSLSRGLLIGMVETGPGVSGGPSPWSPGSMTS